MRQTDLGPFKVGVMAYGCWRFAESSIDDAHEKITTALECGMTLIDTADIYGLGESSGFGGAEAILGEVLKADPSLRAKMVLATKGGIIPPRPYDSSYDYLMSALDASLERLGIDQIDLYQIHRPDLVAPFSEQGRTLDAMVASGRVKAVGVSNFTVSQMRALQAHMEVKLVSTQPEFSAFRQDPITDGTLDWCSETGAACLAWSPLGGGALMGEGDTEQQRRVIAALDKIAAVHDTDRASAALAFTMTHQANVVPIIGTQNTDRIKQAAKAAVLNLTAREFYDVIEAYRGEPMP